MNRAEPTSHSSTIAKWIDALVLDEVPHAVRMAVEDTVIDTVGLGIAALETDYGRAVREAFPGRGDCTIWGIEGGFDPAAAAIVNGTCSHGEDYDNTFEGCPMHSGVVIVPAVLAAGEALRLANADVARGLVVGIEIANRLALVSGRGVHTAGFHPTAILGCVAAAGGVAAAMRLDEAQIRNALGIAGSMASGIIEYLADGSWTKRMHPGWAAQSGFAAARMGRAGFTGPATVFEGIHGLYASFASSIVPDFAPLVDDLGREWRAAEVAFKPYACGTMTQPFIDCAIRLKEGGIDPDDVVAITCEVGEGTVHRLWEPLDLKRRPPTAYAAKFSSPYCVAAGLLHGGAGLAQFTNAAVEDPRARALAAKVSYEIDPDDAYPKNYSGHVRAELSDGRVVEERQPQLRGGVREPLTRAEILGKARSNLAFCERDPAGADRLAGLAEAIFQATGSIDLTALRRLGQST